jgi:hypothetical protein
VAQTQINRNDRDHDLSQERRHARSRHGSIDAASNPVVWTSRLDEFERRAHSSRVDGLSAGALTFGAGAGDSVFGALGNEAALEMRDGAEHVKVRRRPTMCRSSLPGSTARWEHIAFSGDWGRAAAMPSARRTT